MVMIDSCNAAAQWLRVVGPLLFGSLSADLPALGSWETGVSLDLLKGEAIWRYMGTHWAQVKKCHLQ